jgi:hypothetical protein
MSRSDAKLLLFCDITGVGKGGDCLRWIIGLKCYSVIQFEIRAVTEIDGKLRPWEIPLPPLPQFLAVIRTSRSRLKLIESRYCEDLLIPVRPHLAQIDVQEGELVHYSSYILKVLKMNSPVLDY